MKTLNRTLSLTLVFALVFSLMSFAFAADTTTTTATTATKLSDFTDADKLTYTEAADYLIAAGIVKGETATTLNPKGDFTRAQAAKLIAYAALGQTAADNLKVSVSPFKDVDASNWAAGYIAYCQKQGLANGYGDGNFGPNDKVTGYQMAKMLLCSIGYGVNGEFTGSGWELAVAPLALSYGIFTSNAAGASAVAATREEAFLYTFNTLSSLRSVAYNKTLGIYYVPGSDATSTNPASQKADRSDTIGYQRFKMVKAVTTGDYGEAAHYFTINGTKVTDTYSDSTLNVLAKSTDGTPIANLTNPANSKYINKSGDTAKTVFYNGHEVASSTTDAGLATGDYFRIDYAVYTAKAAITKGTALDASLGNAVAYDKAGVVVSFIDSNSNSKYDTISIIQKQVVKLTAAPIVKTSGSVTTVAIADIALAATNTKYVEYPSDLKAGDVILWYTDGVSYYIEKAASSTDAMAGYVSDGTNAARVTVGTTNHFITGLTVSNTPFPMTNAAASALVGSKGYTYYFDNGDNLCYYTAPDAAAVLSKTMFLYNVSGQPNLDGTYSAIAFTSDGNSTTINIASAKDTSGTTATPTPGKFYTFSKLSSGAYALTEVASTGYVSDAAITTTPTAAEKNSYAITSKAAQFLGVYTSTGTSTFTWPATSTAVANLYANDKTVFLYYDVNNKTSNVYTGIKNVPSLATGGNVYVVKDASNNATFVVAYGADSTVSVSQYKQIFVVSLGQVSADANGTATYSYYAYVDGTYTGVISYKALDTGYLYLGKSFASNGYIKDATKVDADNVSGIKNTYVGPTKAVAYKDGIMTVTAADNSTQSFVLSDSVKVVLCDATNKADIQNSVITPANAALLTYAYTGASDADAITLVPTSATDSTIAVIYITVQ